VKIRLPHLLGLLALAVSLVYLGTTAVRHTSSFPRVVWDARAVAALAAATGLYLVTMVVGATVWFLLLRSTGTAAGLRAVFSVWGIAQVGKYLPGNVGQYLGRAALAQRQGIPVPWSALTFVFETTCLIVAAVACAFLARGGPLLATPWKLVVLAAGAVAVPFLLVYILERWFPEALRRRTGVDRIPRMSPGTLGACLALDMVSFPCWGLALEVLAGGLFGAGLETAWWQVVPPFALAWVAGFVAPGAPAGLGVREALLVAGTAPLYGPGIALSAALALRLVTVLGDGLAFLAGSVLQARFQRR
jgi:hypothetical protein